MSRGRSIRQIHRWLSVAFVVAVVVTSIALATRHGPFWVNYLPLAPLLLLFLSGAYLFVLPYLRGGRGDETSLN